MSSWRHRGVCRQGQVSTTNIRPPLLPLSTCTHPGRTRCEESTIALPFSPSAPPTCVPARAATAASRTASTAILPLPSAPIASLTAASSTASTSALPPPSSPAFQPGLPLLPAAPRQRRSRPHSGCTRPATAPMRPSPRPHTADAEGRHHRPRSLSQILLSLLLALSLSLPLPHCFQARPGDDDRGSESVPSE